MDLGAPGGGAVARPAQRAAVGAWAQPFAPIPQAMPPAAAAGPGSAGSSVAARPLASAARRSTAGPRRVRPRRGEVQRLRRDGVRHRERGALQSRDIFDFSTSQLIWYISDKIVAQIPH